jgi:parallel beta-helix repeat protein
MAPTHYRILELFVFHEPNAVNSANDVTTTSSIIVLAACLCSVSAGRAATYYVDFQAGNDHNNGSSESTPWQRAPGDSMATGKPKSTVLTGGDSVLFKGGIAYKGSLDLGFSGTPGAHIIYRGDGWGADKAILEGSNPMRLQWTRCGSPADCAGNTNYAQIYFAASPPDYKEFTAGLFENGEFLWYAQSPNPPDPFNYDAVPGFYSIPRQSSSIRQTLNSITDPRVLTQSEPAFWNGGSIIMWVQGNATTIKRISGFDPATHSISHETLANPNTPYTDRDSHYALLNHPALIDRPGEYALDSVNHRLYLWPRDSSDPNRHEYSTAGKTAISDGRLLQHVTIEGFRIQLFTQGIKFAKGGSNIVIRNNEVRNLRANDWYAIQSNASDALVESNRVENCSRAVGILIGGARVVIRNNIVRNASRQGIWLMRASDCQVLNNSLSDITGTHANGLSVYMNSSNIVVAGNTILNCHSPLTFEQSANLTFVNNIVIGTGGSNVNDWGGCSGTLAFYNNVFVKNSRHAALNIQSPQATLIIRNNILDGGSGGGHNIFTGLGWRQNLQYGWKLGAGELLVTNLATIFVNPDQNDFRLKPGSPAIDAGMDVGAAGFTTDIAGVKRTAGAAWDIGAYEFQGAVPRGR